MEENKESSNGNKIQLHKEKFCAICEETTGEFLFCTGDCMNEFHESKSVLISASCK